MLTVAKFLEGGNEMQTRGTLRGDMSYHCLWINSIDYFDNDIWLSEEPMPLNWLHEHNIRQISTWHWLMQKRYERFQPTPYPQFHTSKYDQIQDMILICSIILEKSAKWWSGKWMWLLYKAFIESRYLWIWERNMSVSWNRHFYTSPGFAKRAPLCTVEVTKQNCFAQPEMQNMIFSGLPLTKLAIRDMIDHHETLFCFVISPHSTSLLFASFHHSFIICCRFEASSLLISMLFRWCCVYELDCGNFCALTTAAIYCPSLLGAKDTDPILQIMYYVLIIVCLWFWCVILPLQLVLEEFLVTEDATHSDYLQMLLSACVQLLTMTTIHLYIAMLCVYLCGRWKSLSVEVVLQLFTQTTSKSCFISFSSQLQSIWFTL